MKAFLKNLWATVLVVTSCLYISGIVIGGICLAMFLFNLVGQEAGWLVVLCFFGGIGSIALMLLCVYLGLQFVVASVHFYGKVIEEKKKKTIKEMSAQSFSNASFN